MAKTKLKLIRFIDSSNDGFEPMTEPTILFADNVTAEHGGYEGLTFRVAEQPIENEIDLAKCRIFRVSIEHAVTAEELNWLAGAKLIDVIRKYATLGGF